VSLWPSISNCLPTSSCARTAPRDALVGFVGALEPTHSFCWYRARSQPGQLACRVALVFFSSYFFPRALPAICVRPDSDKNDELLSPSDNMILFRSSAMDAARSYVHSTQCLPWPTRPTTTFPASYHNLSLTRGGGPQMALPYQVGHRCST